jgi:precorrin-6A synthase
VKRILLIGIGTGDPDHVTVQAVKALNQVDAFFLVDKGVDTEALVALRREICARHIRDRSYRFVDIPDAERDRAASGYEAAVVEWHDERAARYARAIDEELRDGECGAFLVWGDPALYDSTLRIVEQIAARFGPDLDYEVVPGISSVQVLAARHRVPLNRIGGSVHITTGRNLRAGLPDGLDDVVVMLDGDCSFTTVDHPEEYDVYWGAYLGTGDEILVAGNLGELSDEIERVRGEARADHGWIMDTYLLRRTTQPPSS